MDPATARAVQRATVQTLWPELDDDPIESLDAESALMAENRAKAFRLYTRRNSMRQVATELGVNASTICRWVNHVLDAYKRIAQQDAINHVAAELSRLATIETELWEAWDRSKGEAVETFTGKTNDKSTARVTKKQRHGDPRIMKLILDAYAQRCKLLGIINKAGEANTGRMSSVVYVDRAIGEAV